MMPPIEKIVSGGQTGADRAALDWAINNGIAHGGWVPPGRLAEDGPIPGHYLMSEMATGSYRQRTKKNVLDSDGTLILNLGLLDGGTRATLRFATQLGKPSLLVQLDEISPGDAAKLVSGWLTRENIARLNVAGPRESKRPGIYSATRELLEVVNARP